MRLALLAAMLSLAAAGCSKSKPASSASATPTASAKPATAEIPSLTVDQVAQQLDAKQITAVDCNGDLLRKKLGVIPGAIQLADIENYDASVLPADKGAKLVFYCHDPG